MDRSVRGRVRRLLSSGDFSGRTGETLLLPEVPGLAAGRLLLVGLGNKAQFNRRGWRRALHTAITALARTPHQRRRRSHSSGQARAISTTITSAAP